MAENYVFWLDLLNDKDLIRMFCAYINNEINRLNNDKRKTFAFFDGLKDEYISHIYHISIKEYFTDGKFEAHDASEISRAKVKKLLRKNDFEAYEININNKNVIIVKNERKLEFFCFCNDLFEYDEQVITEINALHDKLLKIVSKYRSLMLFNEIKVIENIQKGLGLISLFLGPIMIVINGLIALGFTQIEELAKSLSALVFLGVVLLIANIYIFVSVCIPVFKIGHFD